MEDETKEVKNLLRPHQVMELTEEANRIDRMLVGEHRGAVQDANALRKASKRIRKAVDAAAPQPYEGAEKDKMAVRASVLRDKIQEGMLSRVEMRRNPVGAVDRHLAWEKANKGRILEYKHIMLRLNSGTEERNVANIEKFRPEGGMSYTSEAQISGHLAMSPQAKDNWPLGEAKCDTAAAQAERAEKERKAAEFKTRMAQARAAKAETKKKEQVDNGDGGSI